MSSLFNDLRLALRGFRRTPLFTMVAVLSLVFGIGANTAVFSLLDQILLRYLPVKEPGRLALLTMEGAFYGSNRGMNAISYPMYKDFSEHNDAFAGMFCRFPIETSFGFGNHTERINAELVSGTYFPVLGVQPAAGRLFTPDDNRLPGGHPLAVLSYSFWQNRFSANPAIVGQQITLNGRSMTVVGVAQSGFDGVELGRSAKVFVPIMMKAQMTPFWDALKDRRSRWVNAFGRLKPGVSLTQARASLQPFMHNMLAMEVKEAAFRNVSPYDRQQFLKCWINVIPGSYGRSYLRRNLATPLWVLMGLTLAVLLLACANLANLLIARATTREREFAIRLAIGAGRARIVRQLFVESLLLSGIGGLFGLLLAFWADRLLLAAYLPSDSTGDLAISAVPDLRILAFTICVMLVTAVAFGLLPALQSARSDIAPTLKNQAGAVVGGSNVFARKILVTAQVMLSLLLLIGAGLFMRTLGNLRSLNPGFSVERLVGFEMDPSLNGYSAERAKIFYKRLTDDLRSIPGVRGVGLAALRILDGDDWENTVTIEGYRAKQGEHPLPFMNAISPGYFATLGIPVLQGREFNERDTQQVKHGQDEDDWSPTTIIINESFAKKYFKGRNPIGRHLGFGADPGTKTDMEIIGVVKDAKYTSLRDETPVQAFEPYLANRYVSNMTVYLRTAVPPEKLLAEVRRRAQQLDRNVSLYAMRTAEEQVTDSLRNERLVASLSSLFGSLATLLAVIGLYGVMAYTVARKTREIGIRMALGAAQGRVLWMVLREAMLLVGAGIAIGVPLALMLSRLVQNQLYGLAPYDPLTMISATLGLAAVASVAGFVPAWRASKVDPTRALRYE